MDLVQVRLYNFLTKKIQKFKPLHKGRAFIYACGPTVYDSVHIGNLRTFLFEDFLRRALEYLGFKVKIVMNITDIDDKIIKKAKEEKVSWKEISKKYEKIFFKDLEKLKIKKADFYPRVSEHINEIISLITKLIRKGVAYKAKDGVYFDISKYPKYGALVKIGKEGKKKARISVDEYEKKEATDFALWKAKKQGEPSWQSPWGKGRPGWHIECSAMSMKYLGETFDIHCGGVDLLFPHHENEIAQSQAATGKKFANFFIEGEHLLIGGKKMAKRLKNFYRLEDLKNKGFKPLAFRYLALGCHYQKKLNFTFNSLESAQRSLFKLQEEFSEFLLNRDRRKTDKRELENLKEDFETSLTNNLNTPRSLAALRSLFRSQKISNEDKRKLILKWDNFFALGFKEVKEKIRKDKEKIKKIKLLIKERNKLRKNREWAEADKIRKKILKEGYAVEDTQRGSKLRLVLLTPKRKT